MAIDIGNDLSTSVRVACSRLIERVSIRVYLDIPRRYSSCR